MRARAAERIIEAIDPALRGQFECERLSGKTKGFFPFPSGDPTSFPAPLSDSYPSHQASVALLPALFLLSCLPSFLSSPLLFLFITASICTNLSKFLPSFLDSFPPQPLFALASRFTWSGLRFTVGV